MEDVLISGGMALWLGILTSISPCPLATNIAAISFIGKRAYDVKHVALSGLSYSIGRSLVYIVIGMLVVASIMSVQGLAIFLQKFMNQLLGPVLILTGMLLLELIRLDFIKGNPLGKVTDRLRYDNAWSAGLLGVIFALSFCPVSAGLFFGGLVPLSIRENSSILLPALYGIGTALPVVLFALIIAFSAGYVSKAFDRVRQFDSVARQLTGIVFIAVGIYYSLRYIFNLF